MQLKRLRAFHTVARSKSFSEAVSVTKLSQPTLSRLIKQLEEEIGVELIDRYHRPLQLTPAGDFFYNKIDLILKDIDSTITLTQRMANPPDVLNIGFVPSVLYGLLPTVIAKLKKRLPKLDVHLKDINSFKQVDSLKSGEIDVGFGRFSLNDSNIKQILLRHERYVVALPKSHPLAEVTNIHLSMLQHSRIILYHQTHLPSSNSTKHESENESTPHLYSKNSLADDNNLNLNSTYFNLNDSPNSYSNEPLNNYSNSYPNSFIVTEPLLHLFQKQSAIPHLTSSVSDIQIALGLVAAGEGITLVPDSLKTLRSDQISYRNLVHEDATSPIYICCLDKPTHPAFNILLEVIYEIYEERGITYRRALE